MKMLICSFIILHICIYVAYRKLRIILTNTQMILLNIYQLNQMEQNSQGKDKDKPFTQQEKENILKFNEDKIKVYEAMKKRHKIKTHDKIINSYSLQIPRCLIGLKDISIIPQNFQKHKTAWIIGKIFQVDTKLKEIKFCGTCFMITNKIAVTTAHQVSQDKKYLLKFTADDHYNSFDIFESGRIWTNKSYNKFNQINYSQDYAFIQIKYLKVEELDKTLLNKNSRTKQHIRKIEKDGRLGAIKLCCFSENAQFKNQTFPARIYGTPNEIPEELQKKWNNKFTKNDIIQSKGEVSYKNKQLQYQLSTVNGMSGSPIIHQSSGKIYLIGMHTSGNQLQSKNYAILFNQSFFDNLRRQFPDSDQLKTVDLMCIIEKIRTLKDYLSYKTKQFQTIKEHYDFLGTILNKIVYKVFQFQQLRLSIQSLKLEDIIVIKKISKIGQSRDQQNEQAQSPSSSPFPRINQIVSYQIDFKKLKLIDYPLQKVSQIQYYNIQCLNSIVYQIEEITSIPKKIKQIIKSQKGQQFYKVFPFSKQYLFHMIAYFIEQSMANQKDNQPFQRIEYIKNQIQLQVFKREAKNEHIQLVSEKLAEINKKISVEIPFNFYKHFSLHQYQMNISTFRKKLCYWYKYSNSHMDGIAIAGFYLIHLSILHQKIIKIYKALRLIYSYNDGQKSHRKSQRDMIKSKLNQAQTLSNLPDFHFLLSDFRDKYDESLYEQIRQKYESGLFKDQKGQKQIEQIISQMVKYQIIFYQIIQKQYLKFKFIDNIAKFTQNVKYYNIYNKIKKGNNDQILSSLKFCLQQNVFQVRENIFLNKRNVLQKNPQIFNYHIFNKLFRQPQQKSFSYMLTEVSPSDQELTDVTKIIVRIERQDQTALGSGFRVTSNIIITAVHLFDALELDPDKILSCRIKMGDKQVRIVDYYPKELLSSSERDKNQFADIIYLEIQDSQDFKLAEHEKVSLILHDQLILLGETKHFGLLVGYGKPKDNICKLKKSYGQFQFKDNNCHPLSGQSHLSGSPMLLKFDKTYAVVGVYKSEESSKKFKIGKYTKFNTQQLQDPNFFQNKQINLMTIDKSSNQKVKSTLNNYIQENYATIDHFILRILGEVLRLNYSNIFMQSLSFNNLILNREDNRNIIFSKLKLLPNTNNKEEDHRKRRSYNQQKVKQSAIENKNAFCTFLQQLKSILIKQGQQDIEESIFLKRQSIQFIKTWPKTLEDYFLEKIDMSYDFKGNRLVEKQPSQSLPKIRIIENKYQRHFIRKPKQRFKIRSIILNQLLMQTQAMICSSERMSNISKFYCQDLNKIIQRSQQDKSHSYFSLGYSLFKKGSANIIKKLSYQKNQQFEQEIILSEGDIDEYESDYQQYEKTLASICQNSHIQATQQARFISAQMDQFKFIYRNIKNWTLVSNILRMYQCLDDMQESAQFIGKFSGNFTGDQLDQAFQLLLLQQHS